MKYLNIVKKKILNESSSDYEIVNSTDEESETEIEIEEV